MEKSTRRITRRQKQRWIKHSNALCNGSQKQHRIRNQHVDAGERQQCPDCVDCNTPDLSFIIHRLTMAIIVKSSSLHGAGVYTTTPIKKGALILEYTGPRLTAKACEGMYADPEVTYLFAMDDGDTIIDGFGMAAFVNHTCDPNCETDQIDNRIWIMARSEEEHTSELQSHSFI